MLNRNRLIIALFLASFFVSPARAACWLCGAEEKEFKSVCNADQVKKGLPQGDIDKACACNYEFFKKNISDEQFMLFMAVAIRHDNRATAELVEKHGTEWAQMTLRMVKVLDPTADKTCRTK